MTKAARLWLLLGLGSILLLPWYGLEDGLPSVGWLWHFPHEQTESKM